MSWSQEPMFPPAGAAPFTVEQARQLAARLETLAQENEALGRELLRCYEQLNLVFEITDHIANLQDPDSITRALLRRYGTMLGAGAIYFDAGDGCSAIEPAESTAARIDLSCDRVRAVLGDVIEAVRQTRRTQVPTLADTVQQQLGGARVLLGALLQLDREPGVVIALRSAWDPPFDSGDMLASESVLSYGGHILSNVLMVRQLQKTAVETVCALANAIDAKDNYTCGHSERVGWLAHLTGETLGLSAGQVQVLEWAGLLHDVGKIGIPEDILNKPGKLTPEEFAEMKKHPRMSYEVLKPVTRFEPVLEGVLHHHENHDGSGYPEGLAGEEIPLAARIIHVVDIFDALTSTRSYRQAFDMARAFFILETDSGRVTEPHVTRVFIAAFRRYVAEQRADFGQRFAHLAQAGEGPPVDVDHRLETGATVESTALSASAIGGPGVAAGAPSHRLQTGATGGAPGAQE